MTTEFNKWPDMFFDMEEDAGLSRLGANGLRNRKVTPQKPKEKSRRLAKAIRKARKANRK